MYGTLYVIQKEVENYEEKQQNKSLELQISNLQEMKTFDPIMQSKFKSFVYIKFSRFQSTSLQVSN